MTNICNSKAALIVGAGGIGGSIIRELKVKYPSKKIIVADFKKPSFILDEKCDFIEIDLAKDDLSLIENLDIDTLIFSAGIGRLSKFETFSEHEIEKNFKINTLPFIKLIKNYYDKLNSQQPFYCAVITSIAGYVASPLYSVYSASKAALVKFIQAVNSELESEGVSNRILDVAPGKINTAFHGANADCDEKELKSIAAAIVEKMYLKEKCFIPKAKEVYNDVIKRNNDDTYLFAKQSIEYKLKNNKTNDQPQIKVGYLTGTFDLFHIGHLNLLKNAKKYCDKLIVGIHPDGSHKKKEVFIPLDERIEIVKSVKYVDDVLVCTNEDIDAYPILKYDYLFVGTDYKGTERFARYEKFFEGTGVKIIYLPYTTKTSSTQLRTVLSQKMEEVKNK